MEYEREGSRTVCNVVPKCYELGEGSIYIWSHEIQSLQLVQPSKPSRRLVNQAWGRAIRRRGRLDQATDRTIRSKPDWAPGRDRGGSETYRTCPRLSLEQEPVRAREAGPQAGVAGREVGPAGPNQTWRWAVTGADRRHTEHVGGPQAGPTGPQAGQRPSLHFCRSGRCPFTFLFH
jgi:hypothetical protein